MYLSNDQKVKYFIVQRLKMFEIAIENLHKFVN